MSRRRGSRLPIYFMRRARDYLIADTKEIAKRDLYQPQRIDETQTLDTDVAPAPVIKAYLIYPNFYRIKKWNNSSWYAIAIGELSEKLK